MVDAFLKLSNDFADVLRHVEKRWDNRVRAEGPFAKPYLDGRLSVILELESNWGSEQDRFFAVYHELSSLRGLKGLTSIWPEDLDSRDSWHMDNGRDQFVFISNVEVVDGSEKLVPSLVRFERVKEIDDLWSGPVYCSLENFCLKVFWPFGEREMNAGNAAPMMAHDVARHDVESGPKVVDGIADDQRPIVRHFSAFDHAKQLVAGLRLSVNDHAVWFTPAVCEDGAIQVSDVLIGPVNF
jgi:hypothetical protein